MNSETKQDVFDETLSNLKKMDAQIEGEWGYSQLTMGVGKHGDVESTREIVIAEIRDRYAAALPDDLPVVPEAVSDYISKAKAPGKWGLLDVFWHLGDNISAMGINGLYDWQRWMANNQVAVAHAWVLGVWRVEENGKIVKLEADK